LEVDHREKDAALVQIALECEEIEIHLGSLKTGDYIVEHSIVVERKGYLDLAVSIIDGRLFRQASALARGPRRGLVLIEGPRPDEMPIHSHALKGAVLSLSVSWRLPVVFSEGPEDSLLLFRLMAEQSRAPDCLELSRTGYKPRRLMNRKLYVLQGLPGIGPKTAKVLLSHFGSVERVMRSTEAELVQVPGIGHRKAGEIRELLRADDRTAGYS